MKNSIHIKNFLLLQDVKIDIKEINILIGSQASGKSIVAKLVHYFKGIGKYFTNGLIEDLTLRDVKKNILIAFEKYFPASVWNGSDFSIEFCSGGVVFSICGVCKNNKTKLEISIPEDLQAFYSGSKRKLSKIKNENTDGVGYIRDPRRMYFNKSIKKNIEEESFSGYFLNPIFIPASRSFFSSLSNNIFSFLASNVNIDPYIKEFGSFYESSKSYYFDQYFNKRFDSTHRNEINKRMERLLKGSYKYKNKQDLISTAHGDIPLLNASSGQQEATPLLLVLGVYPFLRSGYEELFFIEEPEAHLFPDAQGEMVSLFSYIHDKFETGFFITTHSPYVLSAINNLVMACNLVEDGPLSVEQAVKINDGGFPVKFSKISAYILDNGVCKSIIDYENNLIDTGRIDAVSEKFAKAMDEMLEIVG